MTDAVRAGGFLLPVLYLDNHLLAVVKPSNLPVQRDRSGDSDALTACKAYIGEVFNKPGDVYLGLVHRLDRPVGGVLLFARTSKAAARLGAQFKGHTVDKRYLAVVAGTTSCAGALEDYLAKDEASGFVRVVSAEEAGAKLARLEFEALSSRDGTTLLSIRLLTGRPHQIRVQLKNAGYPILYDARYGTGSPGTPLALWACRLTVEHPTRKGPVVFCAPPPAREPFTRYADVLEELVILHP